MYNSLQHVGHHFSEYVTLYQILTLTTVYSHSLRKSVYNHSHYIEMFFTDHTAMQRNPSPLSSGYKVDDKVLVCYSSTIINHTMKKKMIVQQLFQEQML